MPTLIALRSSGQSVQYLIHPGPVQQEDGGGSKGRTCCGFACDPAGSRVVSCVASLDQCVHWLYGTPDVASEQRSVSSYNER
jgi:hypothetical protein